MKVERLFEIIDSDFYTGVPDSQLKELCNYLMTKYGIDKNHHIIGANEGGCVAMAAGYHLATGKIPVVYMQNSGEGNIINPLASLLNERVYAIPVIFIIGWRGEPGVHDEPQHIYQGEITLRILEDMGIEAFVIGKDTTDDEVNSAMERFREKLKNGSSVAFVVRKNALTGSPAITYKNTYTMAREEVIKHIVHVSDTDPVISTTGKISRELFEIRELNGQSHKYDFLTVGSMGHSSSIAMGVAITRTDQRIWCIDGDGAAIMHMGAMAVIGVAKPQNMIHIVINNEAHETVGGMPTVADRIDFPAIAKACGYNYAVSVKDFDSLDEELELAKRRNGLTFIEVKCAIGSRSDLGRPTIKTTDNKKDFMEYISRC